MNHPPSIPARLDFLSPDFDPVAALDETNVVFVGPLAENWIVLVRREMGNGKCEKMKTKQKKSLPLPTPTPSRG